MCPEGSPPGPDIDTAQFFPYLCKLMHSLKSILFGVGTVFVAASLTRCAVQEADALLPAGTTFEVFAAPAGTRTANDGMSTLWVEGDRFDLFHARAGSPGYVSDGAFTIDDPASGHATGTVAVLPESASDWYMVYPYSGTAATPEEVPVTVGAAAGESQVQAGPGSREHLCGPGFPLGGQAFDVKAADIPALMAAPLVSVLAVHVTNPGPGDIRVRTVSFLAPEEITGGFTVDVTGTFPEFKAVKASDEAVLSVSGTASLKAGESADFFLGIKPFQAPAGSTLTLTVNDQERTVTLSRDVEFSAGKIKTLNVTLDPEGPGPETSYTYRRVTTVTSGHKYLLVAEDTKTGSLRMAVPLPAETADARMEAEDVTEEDGVITLSGKDHAFVIRQVENGYTLRQPDGRYVYNGNKDNVLVSAEPESGDVWSLAIEDGGQAGFINGGRRFQYNPTSSVRKFQIRKSDTGSSPWLYELQDEGDALVEFLGKTVPGVYDIDGRDWLYADGTSQTSVRFSGNDLVFRIFEPSVFRVVQVTGLPAEIAVDDRFDIQLVRFVKQVATDRASFTVSVVKVAEGKAWLLSEGGTGFIVCIQ